MANKKYKLTDGNMWATDGIHDFGQNKTQRTINSEVNSALGGKAPTNHASTATTYGAASTSNYGHVKLSNTTPSMDGTAAVGDSTDVARANHVHPSDTSRVPTSRKVNNKQLSSDITLAASDVGAAPTDHASTATTYGKGTSSNYGHVKISDSLTDTTPAATGGVVPSMKAVSDLNGAINDLTANDIANNSNVSGNKVKDALNTLDSALSQIGTVIMGSDVTNELRNAQVEEIRTATLTNGTWLLFGYVTFTENFSQRASIYILNGSATLAQFNGTGDFGGPVSCFAALVVNDNLGTKDIKLKIYQTSGATQYVNAGRLTCVKIK